MILIGSDRPAISHQPTFLLSCLFRSSLPPASPPFFIYPRPRKKTPTRIRSGDKWTHRILSHTQPPLRLPFLLRQKQLFISSCIETRSPAHSVILGRVPIVWFVQVPNLAAGHISVMFQIPYEREDSVRGEVFAELPLALAFRPRKILLSAYHALRVTVRQRWG